MERVALDTIVAVQRLLAGIILSVIGSLPIAETFSNVTVHRAALPACCRAHGKHKCAMRLLEHAAANSAVQPGIYPVCDHYPLMPPATFAAGNALVFPPEASELFHAAMVSQLAAQWQSEAWFNGCFERSHLTRGPPTFLS